MGKARSIWEASTELAKLLGAGRKARKTYKAFGLSGSKAERVRDMIHARRKAPMVQGLPLMSPDEVKAFFHNKFPNDPGEAKLRALEFTKSLPDKVHVTGGTLGQRENLRRNAANEYRDLAGVLAETPFNQPNRSPAGGTYYPAGNRGIFELPYASVRGLPGTGVGRHESYHLIEDQMYRDPELRKSMPLLMRASARLQAGPQTLLRSHAVPVSRGNAGVRGLTGTLLGELGAKLAEVPRGGVRPMAHPRASSLNVPRKHQISAVGSGPLLEKADRLLSVADRAGGWPRSYSDNWLAWKGGSPRSAYLSEPTHHKRAHELVTIAREKGIPLAVLGAAVGVGTGIGKAVAPLVRGSEEVAEPDVTPLAHGDSSRPWMWNFER